MKYFVFVLWEINIVIIQGANIYHVTDFVCIMCTIVEWVHKKYFQMNIETSFNKTLLRCFSPAFNITKIYILLV